MDHVGNRTGPLAAPRRNNYFYGKLLDVFHFQMEQAYGNRKRWLMNRLSLGEGVLCGLKVDVDETGGRLCVQPGVAIDALGREIVVPEPFCFDPWAQGNRCGKAAQPLDPDIEHDVTICLAYDECLADYMPVSVADCNAGDECAAGTIVESFCVLVRESDPDPRRQSVTDELCRKLVADRPTSDKLKLMCQMLTLDPCPTPSESPCVVLATVKLVPGGQIVDRDNCTYRPLVYSNSVLLELILCLAQRIEECCAGTPTTTPPTTTPPTTTPPTTTPPTTTPPTTTPPTTTPPTTTPPTTTPPTTTPPTTTPPEPMLKVAAVRLLHDQTVLNKMADPANGLTAKQGRHPNAIQVDFDPALVDYASVVDGKTFIVEKLPGGLVAGTITGGPGNRIRWDISTDLVELTEGMYQVILVGDGPLAIASQALGGVPARRLDGEPNALPSGDNAEGGDFVFPIRIT